MKMLVWLFALTLLFLGCERPTEINQENDDIPPSVPEGLKVYYSADAEIIIDWFLNSQADVKGYNIYRRTENSVMKLIGFSANEYYDDVFLEYDTLYFYAITALDYSGLESALTYEVSAKPVNKYKPLTPASLSINARNWVGKRSVFLKWTSNEEYDITGYKIFRSYDSGFTPDSINAIAFTEKTEYEDTTASEFYVNFYYKLIAVDKGNLESNASAERKDMILESPALMVPGNDSSVTDFNDFIFLSTGAPATYKIIVQTNLFFGEIWQKDITSNLIYDTIRVQVPSGVFYYNTIYYWRVAAFTSSELPNSFSELNKFIIKPL